MRLVLVALLCSFGPTIAGFERRADAQAAVSRTNPGHITPRPRHYEEFTPLERLRRPQAPIDIIAYRLPWPKKDLARQGVVVDQRLTGLCRRGRFTQITDGLVRASLPDGWMGVAFGAGRNLRDDVGVAEPETVYLFEDQGSTGCVVRSTNTGTLERFVTRRAGG